MERILGVLGQTPDIPEKNVDFNPFWKAWRLLEEKHVGEEKFDRQKLVWGAIQGMVASLGDPYTTFFPPQDTQDFKSEIKGEFDGIGAEIGIRKSVLTVIAPIKGSPAEHAGLKAGDKILKIDNTFTNDLTLDEAVHQIRGERGTKVSLTILRNNEDKPRVVEVTRDAIRVPVITTEKRDGGIFVIRLASFSENSSEEFTKAVREYLNSGSTKLVLDLRNNPGGYFSAAVDIASWFLPEGEVVAQEAYQKGDPDLYRSSGRKALENTPTVILINQGSASASEILAGALQEHKKAILIGEKSYGKGSVQELEEITHDTSLKITIAHWLTPNGRSISKEGLTPDIEVKIPDTIKEGEDPQMAKALEYLKSH
jgi:carboxyl-terminal processing protease